MYVEDMQWKVMNTVWHQHFLWKNSRDYKPWSTCIAGFHLLSTFKLKLNQDALWLKNNKVFFLRTAAQHSSKTKHRQTDLFPMNVLCDPQHPLFALNGIWLPLCFPVLFCRYADHFTKVWAYMIAKQSHRAVPVVFLQFAIFLVLLLFCIIIYYILPFCYYTELMNIRKHSNVVVCLQF